MKLVLILVICLLSISFSSQQGPKPRGNQQPPDCGTATSFAYEELNSKLNGQYTSYIVDSCKYDETGKEFYEIKLILRKNSDPSSRTQCSGIKVWSREYKTDQQYRICSYGNCFRGHTSCPNCNCSTQN